MTAGLPSSAPITWDQVAQEADAPEAVKGAEDVRFLRGREDGGQVAVLGQHPGGQGEHAVKPCRPRLHLSHLHQLRLGGLGVIHPSIIPLVNPGNGSGGRAWVTILMIERT
jgi:hypothetical protein